MQFNTSFLAGVLVLAVLAAGVQRSPAEQCATCHGSQVTQWSSSRHANTQLDVATELSLSHAGENPFDVVLGEDCIACHGPTSVQINGGMSEGQALGYFFTTTNALFSDATAATNSDTWSHVSCTTCHSVPTNHTEVPSSLVFFDSKRAQYAHMSNASQLCGQCHGSLHFPDTDHRIYDAWAGSKHANRQADLAGELSRNWVGGTPYDVIYGSDPENCIACHAPTAVTVTGGDEATALDYFFSTTDFAFTTNTVSAHGEEWPGVSCTTCHNPHDPGKLSYFNSSTLQYEVMTNSDQLCGQCHGNLRFPGTDHLSYNILKGTGGIGVPDQQLMPEVGCTGCHMHSSGVDGSNSKSLGGHSWAISVPELDGQSTISCILCHTNSDPVFVNLLIDGWKSDFQTLDATASANVARVAAAMQNVQSPALQAVLAEAQHNLAYAESDESGGFHNHGYLMALLQDANTKALSIPLLNATQQGNSFAISWTGPGTLQSATSMAGPWQDVPSPTNPMVIARVAQKQQQFFRLRP